MNFKTTFLLLIVLAGLGVYIYFSKTGSSSDQAKSDDQSTTNERAVFDVKPEDLVKITITPSDGKPTVLQKTLAQWKLIQPVSANADAFAVDTLARALTGLKSHGTVAESSANASAIGLASPHYQVEFATKDKTYKISVGEKLAVGDNLYVSIDGSKNADVVNTSLLDQLEKPASTYRDAKLVNLTSTQVKRLTIQRGNQTIALEKDGDKWRETQPQQFAADDATVDDLLYPLAGLRATDWVSEDDKDAPEYQLDHPRITVTLSATTQPSTQPASTQPKATVIKFGRYDDVLKKNVLVSLLRHACHRQGVRNRSGFARQEADRFPRQGRCPVRAQGSLAPGDRDRCARHDPADDQAGASQRTDHSALSSRHPRGRRRPRHTDRLRRHPSHDAGQRRARDPPLAGIRQILPSVGDRDRRQQRRAGQ